MKEQLIAYETAILAKEKGFDILIQHTVDGKNRVYYLESGEISKMIDTNMIENWNDDNKFPLVCSAPTQSLLQRWLREVHNIHVCTYWDYSYSNERDLYYTEIRYKDDLGFRVDKFVKDNNFRSYEESLEIGLQEGLKLIK
jgi:hypothetical protein